MYNGELSQNSDRKTIADPLCYRNTCTGNELDHLYKFPDYSEYGEGERNRAEKSRWSLSIRFVNANMHAITNYTYYRYCADFRGFHYA